MGWRGLLRDLQAASRRAEREAARRHRLLERRHKELRQMEEVERAAHEVAVFENRVALLTTVHHPCGGTVNWAAAARADPPAEPEPTGRHEWRARRAVEAYRPTLWDRLLAREEAKEADLRAAVKDARRRDADEYEEAVEEYRAARAEWQERREFASRILAGDVAAYREVVAVSTAFDDIEAVRSTVTIKFPSPHAAVASVDVGGRDAVPAEVKAQRRDGRLSVRPMPESRRHEIHRDYACGCAIRVARELFALLPVRVVVATAFEEVVNPQTGHPERQPILSVAVPRTTARRVRWEAADPSAAMANFVHRMAFTASRGLTPVEPLRLEDLPAGYADPPTPRGGAVVKAVEADEEADVTSADEVEDEDDADELIEVEMPVDDRVRPCKYCRHPVAAGATVCPSCGGSAPYPLNASDLKLLATGCVIFVGLGLLVVAVLSALR